MPSPWSVGGYCSPSESGASRHAALFWLLRVDDRAWRAMVRSERSSDLVERRADPPDGVSTGSPSPSRIAILTRPDPSSMWVRESSASYRVEGAGLPERSGETGLAACPTRQQGMPLAAAAPGSGDGPLAAAPADCAGCSWQGAAVRRPSLSASRYSGVRHPAWQCTIRRSNDVRATHGHPREALPQYRTR